MNILASIIRSTSDLDNLLGSHPDRTKLKGIRIAEAMINRYVAITKGGASARRMKMAAKETEITPMAKMR